MQLLDLQSRKVLVKYANWFYFLKCKLAMKFTCYSEMTKESRTTKDNFQYSRHFYLRSLVANRITFGGSLDLDKLHKWNLNRFRVRQFHPHNRFSNYKWRTWKHRVHFCIRIRPLCKLLVKWFLNRIPLNIYFQNL